MSCAALILLRDLVLRSERFLFDKSAPPSAASLGDAVDVP